MEDNDVKKAASALHLPLMEIGSFRDETIGLLKECRPDLFVVASFGLIIPRWALEIPHVGAVNVHPSLLPKYRGPSPIQWSLINGDRETGITLISMSEKMDVGDILYQENIPISDKDDFITLSDRLSTRVADIIPPFISEIEKHGLGDGIAQKEEDATYTPIIKKEMGRIDWAKSAQAIERQARAFVLWPVSYTFLDGAMLKIFRCLAKDGYRPGTPGTITDVTRDGLFVATGNGLLLIQDVQAENRKRMSAYAFAQGYRGLVGKVLG